MAWLNFHAKRKMFQYFRGVLLLGINDGGSRGNALFFGTKVGEPDIFD
jgi:hypothetical protein